MQSLKTSENRKVSYRLRPHSDTSLHYMIQFSWNSRFFLIKSNIVAKGRGEGAYPQRNFTQVGQRGELSTKRRSYNRHVNRSPQL